MIDQSVQSSGDGRPVQGTATFERWLVIGHEASNTGAPRMLLEVLRGVRAARGPGWSCRILLRRGGTLLPEFAKLGPVDVLSHPWSEGRSIRAGSFRKFIDRPWIQPWRLKRWMEQWSGIKFDLVYNNTATNADLVPAARSFGCPLLTHVHELDYTLSQFSTPAAVAQTLENTDHFLAVSPAVVSDLVQRGVAAAAISLAPNFLAALPKLVSAPERRALREQLNLPADAFVIAGCGYIHWLKGTDLFVEVAAILAESMRKPVIFVWIGGEANGHFARQVRARVSARMLQQTVRFIGPVSDPGPWFSASDAVAITSRVESFSLVALEAAALGRPVVAFHGARGLSGLLEHWPELLVPDFNASAMASLLRNMQESPLIAIETGKQLRARVTAEYLAEPRITEVLALVDKLQRNHERMP